MTTLVEDLSVELSVGLIAIVTGAYTYTGGLGATFYVSYFNTAVIYIIIIVFFTRVYYSPGHSGGLGNYQWKEIYYYWV